MAVLWESLSMVIVYVWSQNNRQVIVNFMFGFKFPALYLPAVLGLIEFVSTGDFYGPLVGILVGHTFYFLSEIYSRQDPRWRTRLQAPGWMKPLVPLPVLTAGGQRLRKLTRFGIATRQICRQCSIRHASGRRR